MSAVQISGKFTVWVCYFTWALTALALTPTSLYPSVANLFIYIPNFQIWYIFKVLGI